MLYVVFGRRESGMAICTYFPFRLTFGSFFTGGEKMNLSLISFNCTNSLKWMFTRFALKSVENDAGCSATTSGGVSSFGPPSG